MAEPHDAAKTGKELKDKSMAEYAERMKGKPTPTQAENDKVAKGEHILNHEPDGSNPDENAMPVDVDHQRKGQPRK